MSFINANAYLFYKTGPRSCSALLTWLLEPPLRDFSDFGESSHSKRTAQVWLWAACATLFAFL
jgi:hypothetical protein